jgi:type III restriction enzyme
MELKRYQERVIHEVRVFLETLAAQQAAGNRHATLDAWEEAKRQFFVKGDYHPRKNKLGKDLPTVCIKVPTGGGKTLLATQILGLIYQTILKPRNGSGLVLWVVPSDQIYRDTLKALHDRTHAYRESLEFALSRRIEVWEKHEIFRLTPGQLQSNLNILILKLASTNRETREQLKFFRDSGGNIVQHFPPENDPEKHQALKAQVPNLDMLVDDEDGKDGGLVKTSLGNLVRLCEPAVILDEGHKATSNLARSTIEEFNASIVIELSATPPKDANVLVRVTGNELLDEHMIKLPINIANSNQPSWRNCLTQAREKREQLAKLAARYYRTTEKLIRPIVLVQVERTGKDQRQARFVHSEDVKQYLMEREGVNEAAIAIKTSSKNDIEDMDLLADGCPVEWIITKSALQEGWDCPFAYILVSLNNTGSRQSMTQLVGRVLRQPYVKRTPFDDLNESYVYCLKRRAEHISREVKKALEQEGYEGDAASVIDRSASDGKLAMQRQASIREEFRCYYREFEGKIYLPRFCVKDGKRYEVLDYFRHLLSQVDFVRFDYRKIDWDMAAALEAAKDSMYRLTLGQDDLERVTERESMTLETDEQVKAWLVASLAFDYFSHKQLRETVNRVTDRLYQLTPELAGRLGLVKFEVRERITGLIEHETDRQTQQAFEKLFNEKRLGFYLEYVEGRFEIPSKIDIRGTAKRLIHDDNEPVQRSLFDYVADDLNEYEKSVALYLDRHPEVLWWYRNLIGLQYFSIQGYRRNKIYPDFVVQQGHDKKPIASVVVVESKGKHLKGNEDTNYKRKVANYFEKVGHKVPWQKLAADFDDETFRVQVLDEGEYADRDWHDDLKKLLESAAQ